MIKLYRYIITIVTACLLLSSCIDDEIYDPTSVMDGEATVNATIFFEQFSATSLGKSSRSQGDAIKEIENLCILLYQKNQLVKSFYADVNDSNELSSDELTGNVDQNGNTNRPNGDNNPSAEKNTPSADIKFTVPAGKYKIYAVANCGDISTVLGENSTIDDLLSHKLTWIANGSDNGILKNTNNEMLGYFNNDGRADDFEKAPELTIGATYTKSMYCWLRRAASKVTVSFDASKLEANVKIYLKSVQILDIPTNCYLGKTNTPSSDSEIEHEGETIYYCESPNPDEDKPDSTWPIITRGVIYGLPAPENKKDIYTNDDFHDELSPALYFYENMQGDNGKDKRQDADGDNELDAPGLPDNPNMYPDYIAKDDVKYGTYIEVIAYYERLGDKGKIIYRFMLGKDIYKDYNAERNNHYKLTLKFNGYANDVDWHIEYRQPNKIIAPDPYYISYLYNESVDLPIKISGNDFKDRKLVAEIIENNWSPIHTQKNEKGEIVEIPVPSHPANDAVYYPTVFNPGVWYGFLSLAKNKLPSDDDASVSDGIKVIGGNKHYDKHNNSGTNNWFKTIWTERNGALFKRTITDFSYGSHPDDEQGQYTVEKLSSGITIHMPYYTRQKQIMTTSGYTGNNPYVAYRRKAVVKLTLYKTVKTENNKYDDIEEFSQNVTIYQVRRCVNPKGIWRPYDSDQEFEVEMKILEGEQATEFSSYESDGPWRASVEIGQDWIELNGVVNGTVEGNRDTTMKFKYKPKDKLSDPSQVRCGIILVEYNNYTCKHRIFVRQGYAPIEMNEGVGSDGKPRRIKWHTQNLYSEDSETSSPLEEGTLFKFRNLKQGILASNNDTWGFQVTPENFELSNGEFKKWNEIKAHTEFGTVSENNTTYSFDEVSVQAIGTTKKSTCRVASAEDFQILHSEKNRQYGYGVLYGEGATTTATDISEVYGYTRKDGTSSTKGMRGCFVYNTVTGNQLFFPIGATGYGRRKTAVEWYPYDNAQGAGKLQYAWRSALYPETTNDNGIIQIQQRPLFYDVYRRPGAMYWCNSIQRDKTGKLISDKNYLDINYFTFEFTLANNEPFAGYSSGTNTDIKEHDDSSAGFIRLVEDL